jgi:hypothetical protein
LSFPGSASLRHTSLTSLRVMIRSAKPLGQISEHTIVLLPLHRLVIRRIHGLTSHTGSSAFRSMASSFTSKAHYSQLWTRIPPLHNSSSMTHSLQLIYELLPSHTWTVRSSYGSRTCLLTATHLLRSIRRPVNVL